MKMIKTIETFLSVMIIVLLAGAAHAKSYQVEMNKGRLIKLSRPALSVVVADPAISDVQVVSPKMIYVNGKSVGETSLLVVGDNDRVILNANISVVHNLSKLKRAISSSFPKAKVTLDSTDSAIILKGEVESPVVAQKVERMAQSFLKAEQTIINLLDSSTGDQVMLKVKVAEVSRNELKRFGISLESVLNTGNFIFGVASGRDIIDAAGGFGRNAGDSSLFGSVRTGSVDINGVIDALEDDGLVSVLAEPNLTTKSGVNASFLAGGEFPIPVVGQDGQVTIEFRPFGVSLDFTPVVMSESKISLTVTPEVSSVSTLNAITAGGFEIPSINVRRASTTVDLGSGESFAIAGLMRRDSSNAVEKYPGLGNLPVVGALFRSSEFRQEQTELVIIVTPYIVRGVTDPKALKLPTDGFEPATDMERIMRGKMYREEVKATPVAPTSEPQPAKVVNTSVPKASVPSQKISKTNSSWSPGSRKLRVRR